MASKAEILKIPDGKPGSFWKKILERNWRQIVVDVGSRGFVSTTVEEKNLLIMIDPDMDLNEPDWGDNYVADSGSLVALKARVYVLENIFPERVDRVQMIAPDPEKVLGMLEEAFPILKVGGEAVVVFDMNSNKREMVRDAIRSLRRTYCDHRVRRVDPSEVDINELLEGELNSGIIQCPEECRVITITKAR